MTWPAVRQDERVSAVMVDPQVAYAIDSRVLLRLLPHADGRLLDDVRRAFASYLDGRLRRADRPGTWQQGWNEWTGARERSPGRLRLPAARCRDCRHGVSARNVGRNLTRTGHAMVCGTCRGTGRGSGVDLLAVHAVVGQERQ
jgi:hypothetical protein